MVIKLAVLGFFILVAFSQFSSANFTPFAPNGVDGIVAGTAIIFAYLGFDAIATGGEEARNPRRDLPLAIIAALVITTVFYILVAVAALGIASPKQLAESEAPLVIALQEGAGISWAASIHGARCRRGDDQRPAGAAVAQSRICSPSARRAAAGKGLASVNQRGTLADHRRAGLPDRLADPGALQQIVELVNVGTLFAFVIVNVGVLVLRDAPRHAARLSGFRSTVLLWGSPPRSI